MKKAIHTILFLALSSFLVAGCSQKSGPSENVGRTELIAAAMTLVTKAFQIADGEDAPEERELTLHDRTHTCTPPAGGDAVASHVKKLSVQRVGTNLFASATLAGDGCTGGSAPINVAALAAVRYNPAHVVHQQRIYEDRAQIAMRLTDHSFTEVLCRTADATATTGFDVVVTWNEPANNYYATIYFNVGTENRRTDPFPIGRTPTAEATTYASASATLRIAPSGADSEGRRAGVLTASVDGSPVSKTNLRCWLAP